jgi:hypothetical protein
VKSNPAAGVQKSGWTLCARITLATLAAACLPAAAQNDNPLTPVPPRAVRSITRENHPEPAPLPPEKIIELFVAREDEYLRAHTMYGFKRSVHLQEFLPSGEKGREVDQESQVYLADNGRRYERSTQQNSQRFLDIQTVSIDAEKASQVPLFPLQSSQLKYYDLIYQGSQPLDELHTYIFRVKPKTLLPHFRLFSGLIYVDDQDLAIVKVYGTWLSLGEVDEDSSAHDSPFSLYEMYYENVDGKYWFPTFIRSEAYVHTKGGDERLRLTVRMNDFKVAKPVAAPAGAAIPPAPAGPSPQPPNPSKPGASGPTKPPAPTGSSPL